MGSIRIDWSLVFFAVSAVLIGVAALYGGGGIGEELAKKNLIWLIIGLILMFSFAFLNYQSLGSYAIILYAAGIFLLLVTLMPWLGTKVKGARSWIRFFGFGFQPAEYMKIIYVIALAKYLTMKESQIANIRELIFPAGIAALPVLLIAIQPDLGYAMMFIPVLFILLYLVGANIQILVGFVTVGFFTLFGPMYLEYHKYIIVDDIVAKLREDHFRLSDAVRSLKFDVWQYVENAAYFAGHKFSGSLGWAKETILEVENLQIFLSVAERVREENPVFLRDFLSDDSTVIIYIVSGAVIYGVSFFTYTFYAKFRWLKNLSFISLIFSLSLFSGYTFQKMVSFKPHQVIRLVSFANPDKFPKGAGYQLRHSIITLGSGQFTGKGMYMGDMTKGEVPFLPEWYNDFIFSVIGEQFGYWGAALILLILFGIVIRGIIIAWQSKDTFGSLLAAGITTLFFLHTMINVGITMGLFPVTGIPLLLVSYGGSSLTASFICIGILLNIHMRRFINV